MGHLPGLKCRVGAAQLHKQLVLQVQGCLFKKRGWLVIDGHSSAMRSLVALERARERAKAYKIQGDPKNKGIQRIQVSDKELRSFRITWEAQRHVLRPKPHGQSGLLPRSASQNQ